MNARIALIDIETAPNLSYTWGKWEQNVIAFEREWYMLCFSVKWLGEDTVKCYALPDYPTYQLNSEDDEHLIRDLWKVFDEADILVAHNGDAFDIKKSNARFAYFDLPPPSTYKTVDTLKTIKKSFKLESNKLSDVGQYLGVGEKLPTGGFSTWLGCMRKDPASWQQMIAYNIQDVLLLEQVYLKIRPWITNHPNLNLYSEEKDNCPSCSSANVVKRGFAYAKVNKYQRWHCKDCRTWYQGKLVK